MKSKEMHKCRPKYMEEMGLHRNIMFSKLTFKFIFSLPKFSMLTSKFIFRLADIKKFFCGGCSSSLGRGPPLRQDLVLFIPNIAIITVTSSGRYESSWRLRNCLWVKPRDLGQKEAGTMHEDMHC